MSITISNVVVVQGTGTYVKESVLEVTFDLAAASPNAGHTFTIEGQIKLTSTHGTYTGGTWVQAYFHSFIPITGLSTGTGKHCLIRVPVSLTQANIPLANYTAELTVQIRAKDETTNEYSSYVDSGSAMSLKANPASVTTCTMPHYLGNIGTTHPYNAVVCALAGSNGAASPSDPSYYRIAQNTADLVDGTGTPLTFTATPTFSFLPNDTDGAKTVSVKVYDSYYNSSPAATFTYDGTTGHLPFLQKTPPSRCVLRIVGASGSENYAGILVNTDGTFTVDRSAQAFVSAYSPIPMTFQILSSSNVELGTNIGTDIPYNSTNAVQDIALTTDQSTPSSDTFNQDANVTVSVQVKDAANNIIQLNTTIRLVTRIYLAHHYPLRNPDSVYLPLLREVGTGGNETVIPETMTLSDNAVRTWPDIFYPMTHSYPVDQFGDIDTAATIALNGVSNSSNDAVVLQNVGGVMSIVLDSKGRPNTTGWTMDGTKNYGAMLSSTIASLLYWTIDNGTNGDFQLEFEWFDLNPNAYGPPYNPIAPYRGDVLAVYDATDPAALSSSTDPATGITTYTIADSTKLKEIMAFTGSGTNVLNLTTGQRVSSNTQGGFSSDFVRGIRKIVLILYTDAAGGASGFKLKSSQEYPQSYTNWNVDNTTGQFWVHKHSSLGTSMGAADSTTKHATYDYMDRSVTKDVENGKIIFTSDPGGEVRADYTYYTGTTPTVTAALATDDDFVEYIDAYVYVLPAATYIITDDVRSHVYEIDGYGRVATHLQWNKDAGVLEWDAVEDIPASRRIIAEYTHHTFKRLTDDGFGDLVFNDPVVVADNTPSYPDYTYADIAVWNEGDAMLEQGLMTFVPRGYDTDGRDGVVLVPGSLPTYLLASDIVDQVLDINRPWDVQRGTADETYTRMACAFNTTFIWSRGLAKSGTGDPNNQSATGILSYWKGRNFGNIPARGRLFGRTVWVLGGTGGTSYPQNVTAQKKRCSLEVSGKYYTNLVV